MIEWNHNNDHFAIATHLWSSATSRSNVSSHRRQYLPLFFCYWVCWILLVENKFNELNIWVSNSIFVHVCIKFFKIFKFQNFAKFRSKLSWSSSFSLKVECFNFFGRNRRNSNFELLTWSARKRMRSTRCPIITMKRIGISFVLLILRFLLWFEDSFFGFSLIKKRLFIH